MFQFFKNYKTYLLIIIVLLFFWIFNHYKPIIYSIPAKQNHELIQIRGRNFGNKQHGSYLEVYSNGKKDNVKNYLEWSDSLISFASPKTSSNLQIRVVKKILGINWHSNKRFFIFKTKHTKTYDVPVQQNSPWPTFRHDRKNTGCNLNVIKINKKLKPWIFQTHKGVFSTPVIDKNEMVYFGSADHIFYCVNNKGKLLWSFSADGIIDSGAALLDSEDSSETNVIVPSGDGFIYKLRTKRNLLPQERLIWKFSASADKHFNSWFEGNIAIGFNGEIYAGNTNFNYYKLSAAGALQWKYKTGSNNWSQAAIANDGTIIWASNDTYIRAVSPMGKELWTKRTLGIIAASAAIGSDGTIYIGSFDSYFYALNPYDGSVKWKFKTNDHIYASVALEPDSLGHTKRILFGSADGFFYALNTNGKLDWKFYTDDAIRSSAAIGRNPQNLSEKLVYFGCSNGKIYSLKTKNGKLHWVYNTTSGDKILKDRNDVNASVALGENGIYSAGENGQLFFIPYDYPLQNADSLSLGVDNAKDSVYWQFISSGGNTITDTCPKFAEFPVITLKLKVIKNHEVLDAFLCNTPLICSDKDFLLQTEPRIDLEIKKSADGHYLHLIPKDFIKAGKYSLQLKGEYFTKGLDIGNLKIGGTKTGNFDSRLRFEVADSDTLTQLNDSLSIFELSRITTPIPSMMASLNQIGFDDMDWALSIIKKRNNRAIIWVQGLKRSSKGKLSLEQNSDFKFPFKAIFKGNDYVLEQKNIVIPITGIPIPFNKLLLSGRFDTHSVSSSYASFFANTKVLDIPNFGKYLVLAGLANDIYKNLLVSGSFITQALNNRFIGELKGAKVQVVSHEFVAPGNQDGNLYVHLHEETDSLIEQVINSAAICIYNEETLSPLFLNYKKLTQIHTEANGSLSGVNLKIPAETVLPQKLKAIVLVNLIPIKEFSIVH